MPPFAAAALVFLSSAAVLVLEILAARLLAPYVGVTLETYTAIIGVILAGIAVGSWLGGKAADARDPRGLIAPLLVVGGALAFAAIPVIDLLGASLRGGGPVATTVLTILGFFLPAAVLSGVTPAVIKIQLASLEETGRVVGRLSALSTAGAIFGTFFTGFLLVAAFPTRPVVRATAVFLILLGLGAAAYLKSGRSLTTGGMVAVLAAGTLSFASPHPCEHESAYYCAFIVEEGESGRALHLDTLRHSYVDLADPSHLEFLYTQWFGDVIETIAPEGEPITALHIGGGGFTMPGYLRAEHPGSFSTVLEVDPLLVDLSVDKLGLERGGDLDVRTGDARVTVTGVERDTYELVIGDAFGGVAVPWHLATREFAQLIEARMTDDGVYVMNVIDYGPRDFLRAEVATLASVFDHVAVIGRPGAFGDLGRTGPGDQEEPIAPDEPLGGNHVVVASNDPLPIDELFTANRGRARVDQILQGADLRAFVEGAPILTDDRAPVDQLLTPRPVD
jgi:MFS family permease